MLTEKSTCEEEVSENFPRAGGSEPLGGNGEAWGDCCHQTGDQESRVSGDGLFVFSTPKPPLLSGSHVD